MWYNQKSVTFLYANNELLESKNIQWYKDHLFCKMVWGILDTYIQKKGKLDHLLAPNTRINSKFIKDLNVKLETIKILKENIGIKTSDIDRSNIFYDICP